MSKNREHFGSKVAVIFAMSGSAIGLGNIWRFPYLAGEYGGAAFIVVYILASVFLSLPIFLAESIIGRRSGANTYGAMNLLAPGTVWKWISVLTIISPLIIVSYYSVVGGWSVEYLVRSLGFGFKGLTEASFSNMFSSFISSPWAPLLYHTIFLGMSTFVIMAGVKGGIEKFSNFSIPLLFVLVVVILVYSLTLPGAIEGVKYMAQPNFSKITPQVVAAAVGQSFYSLSLGIGTILVYSSYIRKEENLLLSGIGTAGSDLLFALIAGFAVMSSVFSAGIAPGSGPGLIFESLPHVFSTMSEHAPIAGGVIAILFFLSVLISALTSAISLLEVGVSYLVEEKGFKRTNAAMTVFVGTWLLGALCSLSFGPLSDIKLLGNNIFSLCDKMSSNFLMTLGALLFSVFVGWKMKRSEVFDEFTNSGTLKFNVWSFPIVYFLIKYIAPITIAVVLLSGILF